MAKTHAGPSTWSYAARMSRARCSIPLSSSSLRGEKEGVRPHCLGSIWTLFSETLSPSPSTLHFWPTCCPLSGFAHSTSLTTLCFSLLHETYSA